MGCDPAATVPDTLLAPGAVLLIGEVHGTAELPALFGEAVCHVATNRPVLVGLEVPGSEHDRMTAFLDSEGSASDREALVSGPFWTSAIQDGRRSVAMAALLERLRLLRKAGASFDVVLFDVEEAGAGPDRDERMAHNLALAARAHQGLPVMAYMGNLHARTAMGAPWNPDAKLLGWYLKRSGLSVKSLDYASSAGTAWVCMGKPGAPREQVCAASEWAPSNGPSAQAGITLFPATSPTGYDGLFSVKTITASPPAVGR